MLLGGGGSPLNPLTANTGSSADLYAMDGIIVNQSLLELAATGHHLCIYCSFLSHYFYRP